MNNTLEELIHLSDAGDINAKFQLGVVYYTGKLGTEELTGVNFDLSTTLFHQAAELGHVAAMNNYAIALYYGYGITRNIPAAKAMFEQAIEAGSVLAQYNLANLLKQLHEGMLPDLPKAVELLTSAANEGIPQAQYSVGCAYLSGCGVQKDKRLAIMWLQMAAEQNYGPAQNKLASTFIRGNKHISGGTNLQKAALWSTMAEKNRLFPISSLKHNFNLTEIYDDNEDEPVNCMIFDYGDIRDMSDERILLRSSEIIDCY